jgi:sugar phosphate isomerase/epimerase
LKLACQEHLLPGDGILEKWEFAASAGFDGIELRGMDDWRERLGDLKEAQKRGVVFSSVCLISDRFIGDLDADRRHQAVEHMKSLLSGIAELGGVGAITPAAFGLTSNALPPFEAPVRRTKTGACCSKRSKNSASTPTAKGRSYCSNPSTVMRTTC